VTKDCAVPGVELVPVGDNLVAKVNVSGAVCNNGQDGLTMTVDSLVDVLGTNPLDPKATTRNLTPANALPYDLVPGDCLGYTDSYFPSEADGDSSPASLSIFSDAVRAHATNPRAPEVTSTSDSAHCPICPPN
jgi:hypothetical protein